LRLKCSKEHISRCSQAYAHYIAKLATAPRMSTRPATPPLKSSTWRPAALFADELVDGADEVPDPDPDDPDPVEPVVPEPDEPDDDELEEPLDPDDVLVVLNPLTMLGK